LEADLKLAIKAARAAGDVVMKSFRTVQEVRYKSPDQPLTDADLAADALLMEMLRNDRPDYGWLSEETADTPDRLRYERVWLVDPIDGTQSFVAGRPEFVVSVGLAERGEAVVGVVLNPATNELFTATRGGGAYKEDVQLRITRTERRPVMAASRGDIQNGFFDSYSEEYDLLPSGSSAYKLTKVASGAADVFISVGPKSEWDLCAAGLIVEEAGGLVSDVKGVPLQYNRPNPHINGVVAARADIHSEIIERVNRSK
jgi:myo-inositol-1(or 4)-monophosphatase